MVCVGTGVLLILTGGVVKGMAIGHALHEAAHGTGGLRFVRVADVAFEDDKSGPAADVKQVAVGRFSFTPATAAVPVGTMVTWMNHDDIPHNVVNLEQKFKSQALDIDETFSHTFDAKGTYKYYCSIHPPMTGQVVVR
jgi:plastocyanin